MEAFTTTPSRQVCNFEAHRHAVQQHGRDEADGHLHLHLQQQQQHQGLRLVATDATNSNSSGAPCALSSTPRSRSWRGGIAETGNAARATSRTEFHRPSVSFGLQAQLPSRSPGRDRRLGRRCALADSNGSGNRPQGGDGAPAFVKSRREMLQEYVNNVQPEFMEKFVKRAPEQVVEAMRQTVTNMLGTLPPQFFEISVSTVAENLAQLMYSVMMTGYMFRNAQFRMDLQQSFSQVAIGDPTAKDPRYEKDVNKGKVSGEVLRWHKEDGVENIPAVEYIEMLESEVHELRQELESSRKMFHGRNVLLEYLKSLQPQNLQELTATAGEDALDAMNTFVGRLLGMKDPAQLKKAATETSATELAKLLYWLMVVGYSIRNIEVRYDMERILGVPVSSQKLAELPPGENI